MIAWLKVKGALYAAAALAVSFIGLIVRNRYLAAKTERLEEKADNALAEVNRRRIIDEKLSEVDNRFSRRAAEAREARERKEVPPSLKDSNDW